MSKGDINTMNDEVVDDSDDQSTVNSVYKNLRRSSVLLPLALTFFLPALLLFFNIACTPRHTAIESFRSIFDMSELDLDCSAIVLGWLLIQSALYLLIRNKHYRKGDMTFHRRNRIVAFSLSLGGVYLLNRWNILRASYVYDNIHKILIASIAISYLISLLLFIKGTETRRTHQINPVVAFFYGTEINLTVADLDLKSFLELRAGLIGWACLNLCFLLKTMELYTYRRPPAFVLVLIQQILKALQLIWYEDDRYESETHKKETIGFVRVFGSLCWFPFLWCLPSQYLTLVNYPIKRLYIIASVLLFLTGMLLERNNRYQRAMQDQSCQKNRKSMLFTDGFITLTSNCAPSCQRPSYLGNLLIFIAWALPCGLTSNAWILPTYYLLVICHQTRSEDQVFH